MTQRIHTNTTPDTKAAALLEGIKKSLGKVPNMFATLAHSAAALGFYTNASGALSATALPAKLREQLALAVAGANDCEYCASAHTFFGKMSKLDEAELARNLQGTSSDAKTQAALVFALEVVKYRGHVSDAALKAVRDAGYSDGEITEIIAVVALNTFTNYINSVARTDVDFPLVATSAASRAA